jgi:hypothetical protein
VAAHAIDLQARKRQLLAESEFYRQTLAADCAHLNSATSWISTTLRMARLVAPVLAMAMPVAGFFFRSRKKHVLLPPPKKKNLLSSVLAGYRLARQVKPIWDGFRRARTAPH